MAVTNVFEETPVSYLEDRRRRQEVDGLYRIKT